MTLIYRPKHPKANSNGMVDRALVEAESVSIGLHVISDEMAPTRHMVDGNYYTSKAKFRAVTKAHNCVEVGTDTSHMRPRRPVVMDRGKRRDDIRRAIYELRNGIRRGD